MAFRLQREEGIEDGLHRIVSAEFASIEQGLRALQLHPERHDGAIHDTRKHVKKLRALRRLYRPELGVEMWRRENEVLGQIGRAFSPARDAEVRVHLLSELLSRHPTTSPKMKPLVHHWEVQGVHALHGVLERKRLTRVLHTLEAAHSRFELCPLSQDASGWDLLHEGLRKSYQRARHGLDLTHEAPDQETSWHTWRKRAKVLQYQLTLLEPLGKPVRQYLETLDTLTDTLGKEHDLQVLAATLESEALPILHTTPGAKLMKAIHLQRARLQKKAHALGEDLLDKKTGKFVGKIHRSWRRWQG